MTSLVEAQWGIGWTSAWRWEIGTVVVWLALRGIPAAGAATAVEREIRLSEIGAKPGSFRVEPPGTGRAR
ncbi:MAG: hypothetical protein KJ072_19495 [Verrucomicrobia bacterium]|nr:hypothetical protein [Verrucomicrobiota bacterium]